MGAGKETLLTIIGALGYVFAIVVLMGKHFKDFLDVLPSLRKMLQYVQKKWFSNAMFRADVLRFMNTFQLKLNEIEKEVKPNGGGSMNDRLARIEAKMEAVTDGIEYNRQVREINDKCAEAMIFKVAPDGSCYFINNAFLKFFGWQESEVVGFGFEDLVHDEDRPEMRLKWQKAIDTKTNFKDEQRIQDINGVWHTCQVTAYPVVIAGVLRKFKGIIEII